MTSVAPVSYDQDFQGASPSATDKVPAATLDSQFQVTKAKVNELLIALAITIRDDNTLNDECVRIRNLHPELAALIASKAGWQPKTTVAVATTANIALTGEQTIDGVLTSGSRVRVGNQSTPSQNGLYVSGAGAWTRATDADTAAELGYAFVYVTGGTTQAGTTWVLTQAVADIVAVGTTSLTWSQVGGTIGPIPVNKGGTGAITAALARPNLGISAVMDPVVIAASLELGRAAMGVAGVIDTMAQLKALTAPASAVTYLVRGYYVAGDGGGGTFRWNIADATADNGGTSIQPGAGGAGRWNRLFEGMVNVRWFGAKADGVTNDVPAINAANTYLASLSRNGTLYFPNGTYFTTSGISIPAGVSWLGEEPGWYYGASEESGVIIYKQHTQDAVTIANSNTYGQYIDSIGILGRGLLDTGGSGFVLAKAAACVLRRCNVFHVYVHSFVIGDGTASAYTNTLEDCYSNNPQTGSNYVINSTLFRGHKLISDGGIYGISFSSVATNWSIGECHFEGWKTNGMLISNSQGKTYGKTYLACTYATTLTGVLINGSANGIVLTGLQIANGGAGAGSIGISITGTASGIVIRDTSIAAWSIGIADASGASPNRTVVEGCTIGTCTKGITSSVSYCNYLNNFFYGSTLYDIEHIGGTGGLWSGNKMSLAGDFAFKPTYSGQSGNFNGNCVKNNAGYVSRNSGYVASLANNGTIDHGLSAAPLTNGSVITVTPTNVGLTSAVCVYSPDTTKFYSTWTGTTPNSFTWEARLVCDF